MVAMKTASKLKRRKTEIKVVKTLQPFQNPLPILQLFLLLFWKQRLPKLYRAELKVKVEMNLVIIGTLLYTSCQPGVIKACQMFKSFYKHSQR